MRKILRLFIALSLIAIPILGRYLWFNQGSYTRAAPVAVPDYASIKAPAPVLSTPAVVSQVVRDVAPLVVIDYYHANAFSLDEIEPFTSVLTKLGARVEINDGGYILSDELKAASALIIISPVYAFNLYEINDIRRFVERGGKLLVISDPTRNLGYDYNYNYIHTTAYANALLAPYGMAFADDYVYNVLKNEGNFRNVILTGFGEHPVNAGLKQVVFYSAQSLALAPQKVIMGDANVFSSLTDQGGSLAVMAAGADGRVIALGDMTFMTLPYIQVMDNQKLVENLAAYLVEGTRQHDLADAPYLFSRPVGVLVSSGVENDATLVSIFNELQTFLKTNNLSLSRAGLDTSGKDLLVTGLLPVAEDVQPYIQEFGLVFNTTDKEESFSEDDYLLTQTPTPYFDLTATPTPYDYYGYTEETPTSDTVTIPGLGELPLNGMGLILYKSTPERNTIILLAYDTTGMRELLSRTLKGSFEGCVVTPTVALCPIDSSGSVDTSGYDYGDGGGYYYPTPTPYLPGG